MSDSKAGSVKLELVGDGKVAHIVLNEPDKLNAIAPSAVQLFSQHLRRIAETDQVRAVVVRGEGRAFCSGADLSSEDAPLETVADWRKEITAEAALLYQLWSLPQPTIAAIHGYCLGLGCDLMLACDFAIAADTAKFGEPEIKHAAASTFLIMPYVVAMRDVKAMLLTGAMIDAPTAREMRLVTRVVPADDLHSSVAETVDQLCRIPRQALRMNKIGLNRVYELMGLKAAVDYNVELMSQILVSDSAKAFDRLVKERGLREALKLREEGLEI